MGNNFKIEVKMAEVARKKARIEKMQKDIIRLDAFIARWWKSQNDLSGGGDE